MFLCELMEPRAYKPTDHERVVLAIVMTSDTPQMADRQLSHDEKLNYSKEHLIDMGFLESRAGGVEMSTTGMELAKAQALTDDSGQASDAARELASTQ